MKDNFGLDEVGVGKTTLVIAAGLEKKTNKILKHSSVQKLLRHFSERKTQKSTQ